MTAPVPDPWWLSPALLGEVARLFAQLCGALLIAWLTVRWALRRYKSEKMWDRQTEALVNVLAAISELYEITQTWWAEDLTDSEAAEEEQIRRRERYRSATERAKSVASIAAVRLPSGPAKTIESLIGGLASRGPQNQYEQWADVLEARSSALERARDELVAFGRSRLNK